MTTSRYVKGVPFFNKRYIKGLRVGPRGGASPYLTLLSTPSGVDVVTSLEGNCSLGITPVRLNTTPVSLDITQFSINNASVSLFMASSQ